MSEDISFDEDCRLRVLKPELHDRSEGLVEECQTLITKVQEFQSIVASIFEEVHKAAESTEHQALKAIGVRNKLGNEPHDRKIEEAILLAKIRKKEKEIDQHQSYINSLLRAEADQVQEIEKLQYGQF